MSIEPRRPPANTCVNVCVIDEARQICTSCARRLDEIAVCAGAEEALRTRVWAPLPVRAAATRMQVRRLDWQGAALLDAVADRFAAAAGTFVAGVYGAVAEVLRDPDEPYTLACDGARLTLATASSALRFDAQPWMTAFEVARPDRAPLIALAVPISRAGNAGPAALTALGPDDDTLLPRNAGGARFDLGLGRRAARFTIRCDADTAGAIVPYVGIRWPACLGQIGAAVLRSSPVRVIEAPGLRAEVDAVIPPPGGVSPDGPHTHLVPCYIAQGFDTPPNIPLPKDHVPTALFYPK